MKINTAEEWLRRAVEEIDTLVFTGDLDILNHPFQICWGRVKGKKDAETIQPSDSEQVTMDDFFPTTICVNFEERDMFSLLAALTHECIKAFFNVSKGKQFGKLCERYYFDKPYKAPNPSPYLGDLLRDVENTMKDKYGEFPGKPVKFPVKEKKESKSNKHTIFCPTCGLELEMNKTMYKRFGNVQITCACGTKMGMSQEDEVSDIAQEIIKG